MELIAKFDFAILDFIQYNLKCEFADIAMKYITMLGDFGIVWIIIGIILILQKSKRKYGIMIFISLLLCMIIGTIILKPIVGRIRPFELTDAVFDTLLAKPPKDYSFPSGHTLASFACITILFHYNKKKARFWLVIGLLIAFSRMYLYVHYPTDIIFGVIIGIIIGKISKWSYYFIEKKKLKKIFQRNNIVFQREKQILEEIKNKEENNENNSGEIIDNKEDNINNEIIENNDSINE